MPHAWALVDSSFPTFADNEKTGRKIEKLVDYMKILVEALQYQLENLDTENWNVAALETFQLDTTAGLDEQTAALAQNMTTLTNNVGRMSGALSGLENLTAQMKKTLDGLETVMQVSEDGSSVIGAEGKDLHLKGNVYINGKPME